MGWFPVKDESLSQRVVLSQAFVSTLRHSADLTETLTGRLSNSLNKRG